MYNVSFIQAHLVLERQSMPLASREQVRVADDRLVAVLKLPLVSQRPKPT